MSEDYEITENNLELNQEYFDSISHIESEAQIGLEPITKEERDRVLGVTKSRNSIVLAKDREGDIVVVKSISGFKEDFGGRLDSTQLAENEINALSELRNSGIVFVPELAHTMAVRDRNEDPVVITKYKDKYTPLSSIKPILRSEVTGSSKTNVVEDSFRSLSTIHKAGRSHGDAHLENFGVVPTDDPNRVTDSYVIDFEMSIDLKTQKPRGAENVKTDDIMYLASHIAYSLANGVDSYEDVPIEIQEFIKEKLRTGYYNSFDRELPPSIDFELEAKYNTVSRQMKNIDK